MSFSGLALADLAPENQKLALQNAANPANPANLIDLKGNALANLLLIPANPLLIDTPAPPATPEISNRLANFSKRLANEESLIADEKQADTARLAELATLAASETAQKAITPQQAAALTVLQTLYARCVAHLVDGGHDGKGALVHRRDYWRALHKAGIDTDTVFALLDHGRIRTQAEGLYWWPVVR